MADSLRRKGFRAVAWQWVMAIVIVTTGIPRAVANPTGPQLSSKPGAAYTIYLNFSGFTWNQEWGPGGPTPGVTPAYNSDNGDSSFSGTEMARIHEIWSRTAEKYAAFNVNITTVDPASASLSDYDRQVYYGTLPRFMHTVIGGSGSWSGGTGVSYIDVAQDAQPASNASWKMNWVFPTSAISNSSQGTAEIIAHENGHALGLWHQSDVTGTTINSGYSNGTNMPGGSTTYGPIMGASRGVTRGLWSRGYASVQTWNGSAWVTNAALRNDIGEMLTINSSFTVVDDGIGHTQGTATPIKAINGTIDFTTAKGMITTGPGGSNPDPTNPAHYTNDYWSFTTTGGNVTLNALSGRSTMNAGVADPGRTLDAKLTLFNSSGVEIATTSYAVDSFDATISQNLAAGTYYAKISPTMGPSGTGEVDASGGYNIREFFDIGSYFLTGTIPGLSSDTTRYWDNASGNGFGNAGGTWTATTSNVWNTDSTGNAARGSNVSIAALDAVHFGTDSVGLGAGTVTVSGNVTANRISFGAASGNVTLSGGTIALGSMTPTVTVNNASSTIASVVAGNGGIIKEGTGTLVLSGANTLYGPTAINAGTLRLTGNGTLSEITTVTTASGATFDISGITASSDAVGTISGVAGSFLVLGSKNLLVQGNSTSGTSSSTYAGVISGSGGSLTKYGMETLVLTGNNTYTGGTTLRGGTLAFASGSLGPSGNITFTGNAELQWNSHTQDVSSRIVMTNGVTATIDTNNNAVTFASAIGSSSTAGLTKVGGNSLTLEAASTYSGVTTVAGGTLVLGHASALPGGTGVTGGTSALTFNGGVLGLAAGDFTRNLGTAGTVTAVNFAGNGGWAAYGADRTVNLGNDGHEIAWATANTGLNGRTLLLGTTTATHKVTFQNALNLGSNATRTVQADNGSADIDGELAGVITGSTGGSFTKSGTGTLALTNTNTYVGVTTVSAGTLDVSVMANGGANSGIGASSNAASNLVLSGGTLRYSGSTVSTDRGFTLSNNSGLDASGVGPINFTNTATPAFGTANATRTLTLTGTNTGNNTLAADLANNGTGAVSVTKTGTGTWVLSGSNTYTGTTTVSGGTLVLLGAAALSDSAAVDTNASGARLDISGITASSETVGSIAGAAGSEFFLGAKNLTNALNSSTTYAGAISGVGGSLTKTNTGTLTLTGNNTYTGGTNIAGGTLSFNNVGLVNTSGSITFTGNGSLQWNGHTQDLSSRIVMGNGVTSTIDTNGQGVTFASELGSDSTGTLRKFGGGTLTLTAATTYTGGTNIAGGTLALSGSGAIADASAVNTSANGARLDISGITATGETVGSIAGVSGSTIVLGAKNLTAGGDGTDTTYGGVISGTNGSLTKTGAGNLTLTAANTYTGSTIVGGGTLVLSGSGALSDSSAVDATASGARFDISGITAAGETVGSIAGTAGSEIVLGAKTLTSSLNSSTTYAGVISGTGGSLTKTNTGTLTLSGSNSYTGVTTISGGTLEVSVMANGGANSGIGASSNASTSLVLNGGTLRYTGSTVSTDRGFTLSNNSGLDASGVGPINFTNTATPAFGTANATRTLTLTGTNTGNNTLAANLANNGTGAVSVTKTDTGTWVLSGTNTYTGTTTLSAGTLEMRNAGAGITQSLGAITLNQTDGTLNSRQAGSGTLSTTFGTLTRSAGATGNIVSIGGTNGTDNVVNVSGAAGFVDKGVYFGGSEFAARNSVNGHVRALAYGSDPSAAAVNTVTASNHVKVTATPASQNSLSLLSLNLSGSGVSWTNNATQTLTVPGIIKSGGGGQSTISGGTLATGSNAELVIRTDTVNDSLLLSSVVNSGSGILTKSGAGMLTLNGTNTFTGQTHVNAGTLSIGANVHLGAQATGATLNLKGGTLQATGTFGLYNGTPGTNNRSVVLTNSSGVDVTASNSLIIAGAVSGSGSLTKSGTGTLALSGANTYSGTTTVSAGSLVISGAGSINTSSAINVAAGAHLVYNSSTALTRAPSLAGSPGNTATLSGTGTISAALALDSLGDVLSPGNSPGLQPFGTGQTWNSFTYQWEVNDWSSAVVGTNFDRIGITGGLSLSGSTYELDLYSLTSLNASGDLTNFSEVSRSWTILTTTAGISGFESSEWTIDDGGFTAGTLPAGSWSLGLANGGNDLMLSYAPVPEPGTLGLLAAGLAAGLWLRRRSRCQPLAVARTE